MTANSSQINKLQPSVISTEQSRSSITNTPNLISSGPIAAPANVNRKSILIQNHSTSPLYIRFGADATTSVFHAILKGCSTQDDGTGGSIYNDEYTGVVSVAGSSMRFTVLEL
jgi:hypothetical protein